MSLETTSQKLKDIVATYDTEWFLGDINFLMKTGKERAPEQLGKLSSPMRQLYYIAGLNISSIPEESGDTSYSPEKWNQIVTLLNEIENEYQKLFFPNTLEEMTDEWKRVRQVAMPSFLSYFNQGPLNYEEQVINWIRDLFTPLDNIVESSTSLQTEDFIQFYENIDRLNQKNFQAHTMREDLLRPNWKDYTKIRISVIDEVPDFIKKMGEQNAHLYSFMADHGMMDRFYPEEIVSEVLPIEKATKILGLLSTNRSQKDFLYYTNTKPGNPLYEKPFINVGNGLFQVFEVKQVIHAIENFLEEICTATKPNETKYIRVKGKLLENRIVELFSDFFKGDYTIFRDYYVDGNDHEQDILFLWKEYAFIIEAKGYSIREPFRNPEKAFVRIKDDFNSSIGYGYTQTRRVENKFIYGQPLRITDKNGNLIEEIDTTRYKEDFSIIVNLKSFGQVQADLSSLLKLENDDDIYPWVVKLDDLEIFLLTMIAKKKTPNDFINFLLMRETLHEKIICSDELEICGAYLSKKLNQKFIDRHELIVTTPDLGDIFDQQYNKTMGFKNEKYIDEKKGGKTMFW